MAVLEITEEQIIKVLEQLLPEQRERILNHFTTATQTSLEVSAQKRKFGRGKDKILYMADDFDAPLEDFAEYM
ncbi:DUF2281 domain-containing protein [Armatimonas sp.]|uniref:DUF2281 domain-containing protein n=1 Tax=Armatimonas sp. TaxID=1872638 RepID=UPI00286C059B|nr:DUF2281 domain-containing protein [Armatimonas sp.]